MSVTARTQADLQDELRSVLDSWEYEIREERRSYESLDPVERKVVTELPPLLAVLRDAVERDPLAAWSALRLGLLMGLREANGAAVHRRREAPDVERGQKVKRAAAEGARARWEDPRVQRKRGAAVARVSALHRSYPKRSRTDICRQVGKELEVSGRTIQRYTTRVRW